MASIISQMDDPTPAVNGLNDVAGATSEMVIGGAAEIAVNAVDAVVSVLVPPEDLSQYKGPSDWTKESDKDFQPIKQTTGQRVVDRVDESIEQLIERNNRSVILPKDALKTLLDRFPEDIRNTLTVQVGAIKVHKPSETKINESQEAALAKALNSPSQINKAIKVVNPSGEVLLKIAQGEVKVDKHNVANDEKITAPTVEPKQVIGSEIPRNRLETNQLQAPSAAPPLTPTLAQPPTKQEESFPKLDQTRSDIDMLKDTINRLEMRVSELEQKISQAGAKVAVPKVNTWMNSIRDGLSQQIRQTAEKVSVKLNSLADKIATEIPEIKEKVEKAIDQQIDAGHERHRVAVTGATGALTQKAFEGIEGAKRVLYNPGEFLSKVAEPTISRMIDAAENMPGLLKVDANGTKSVQVEGYVCSKTKSGEISMKKEDGTNVTHNNISPKDFQIIKEMNRSFPSISGHRTKIKPPEIEVPKVTVKV